MTWSSFMERPTKRPRGEAAPNNGTATFNVGGKNFEILRLWKSLQMSCQTCCMPTKGYVSASLVHHIMARRLRHPRSHRQRNSASTPLRRCTCSDTAAATWSFCAHILWKDDLRQRVKLQTPSITIEKRVDNPICETSGLTH